MRSAVGRIAAATSNIYYRILESYYGMLEKSVGLFVEKDQK